MASAAAGPRVCATAIARLSSTTGEWVRRLSSAWSSSTWGQSIGSSACSEAIAACPT
jgi:hypothetical protein